MSGRVYLVGAGPGDPGLMTVKGLELLRGCDAVVYDALIDPALLEECRPGAELIDAGKRSRNHHLSQWRTNELLVKLASEGKTVVRLKGGDPFLFGRGAEEAEELRRNGVEVHVVPGVSSSISVPELAGIPVTHRDHVSSVVFITGHEKDGRSEDRIDWRRLVGTGSTIVILMGLANAEAISAGLIDGGMPPDMPAAVLCSGSTDKQRTAVTTVGGLADAIRDNGLEPPGIMIVGTVVGLRDILGDMS